MLAGDERAWEAWYEENFDFVYRYVFWQCGGRHDRAEEVAQETWLTAVRRVRDFDAGQGSFGAWLRGIALNVIRNQRRAAGQRRCSDADVDQLAAPGGAVDSNGQDRTDRVASALLVLPERYQQMLRAKYFEKKSVAQIAAEHDESPKAIESALSRARDALRKAYLSLESGHE